MIPGSDPEYIYDGEDRYELRGYVPILSDDNKEVIEWIWIHVHFNDRDTLLDRKTTIDAGCNIDMDHKDATFVIIEYIDGKPVEISGWF